MSGRSLSNGTLSMRFMQNAARAKQLAQAELEQAKVKDEAEWEVPAVVRESWGVSRSTREVQHEGSYVPFMCDLEDEPSSSHGYRGRRKFDAKGQEVLDIDTLKEESVVTVSTQKDWSKGSKRPVAISGSSVMVNARKDNDDGKKTKPVKIIEPHEARSKMFDSANVGDDLRPRRSDIVQTSHGHAGSTDSQKLPMSFGVKSPSAGPASGFLKPAGIDAPQPVMNAKRLRDAVDGKEKKKKKQRTGDP